MIKIVGKGYKYFIKQFDDFLGVNSLTVVSLKSVNGGVWGLKMGRLCREVPDLVDWVAVMGRYIQLLCRWSVAIAVKI
ncbi:MAG: hypothetical protein K0A89_08170 [ANME-2 cluster archaeon]|nr:hypothetical protein [ANME-2 cluster archaeon]